ncbi:unnamed protein product [Calypogeia fissa]
MYSEAGVENHVPSVVTCRMRNGCEDGLNVSFQDGTKEMTRRLSHLREKDRCALPISTSTEHTLVRRICKVYNAKFLCSNGPARVPRLRSFSLAP